MASRQTTTHLSVFQSTPSARRATVAMIEGNFRFDISIHALREEGDRSSLSNLTFSQRFQSTPSARRATAARRTTAGTGADFNPRPPRGGRHGGRGNAAASTNFNPRPPRGGRHSYKDSSIHTYLFQSTPSARRATVKLELTYIMIEFQSTPSARRATGARRIRRGRLHHFNPRPPRGGRRL